MTWREGKVAGFIPGQGARLLCGRMALADLRGAMQPAGLRDAK